MSTLRIEGKRIPRFYTVEGISVKQMDAALNALRWMADGKAKSHPLWAFIKKLEKERAKHDGFLELPASGQEET